MTQKNNNLMEEIRSKLEVIPQGGTLEQLTDKIKQAQQSSLIDSTLHDVLTIPANTNPSLVNRLTHMTEPRLMDDYYFKVMDICGYKRFASESHKRDFEEINIQIKESYMAMGGGFWQGIVDILAGRNPTSGGGLFRSLLGGFMNKVTNRDEEKRIT